MSRAFLICALVSTLAGLGGARQSALAADVPPEAVRLHKTLSPRLQPSVRSWVGQEGKKLAMSPQKTGPDVNAIRAQVRARFAGQTFSDMDVESLVVMVMMETAAMEEQEIRDQLEQMKKVNAEKERLRAIVAELRKQREAVKDDLKAKYDAMNEQSQVEQLRLQMMMDRRARLMETLSNLMKKFSDIQSTLIQNLK